MKTCNCLEIVEAIKSHAKGKLCSRFILALERVETCLEIGSPKEAIRMQDKWFSDLKQQAPKGRKKNKK